MAGRSAVVLGLGSLIVATVTHAQQPPLRSDSTRAVQCGLPAERGRVRVDSAVPSACTEIRGLVRASSRAPVRAQLTVDGVRYQLNAAGGIRVWRPPGVSRIEVLAPGYEPQWYKVGTGREQTTWITVELVRGCRSQGSAPTEQP
jgi:hypothetical protein